jgi:ubiquitin C-terminal hydrolase
MSILSPSRTKSGILDHVKGSKVSKATDHSKWHRQKQRHGSAATSPAKPTVNGVKDDKTDPAAAGLEGLNNAEEAPAMKIESDHVNDTGYFAANKLGLQKLLADPIHFHPATKATSLDEQHTKLIKQSRSRKVLSDEHRLRRLRTDVIAKTWPKMGKPGSLSSDSDNKSIKPLGLSNPHNFCYRRSVLQAFLHIPILHNWLHTIRQTHAQKDTHDDRTPCLACAFSHLSQAIRSGSRQNVSLRLKSFDSTLRALAPRKRHHAWLGNISQADAHEFMLFIIDAYHDLLNLPMPLVFGLFKIQLTSSWTCIDCASIHTSAPVDETGLQITLKTAKAGTVALADHVKAHFSETLSDARCENPVCQSKVDRKRTRMINAAPEVLIVQIGRFLQHYEQRSRNFRASKDNRAVSYERLLDLSAFAVNPDMRERGTLMYRLSSVVAHAGSLNMGHYIAFAEGAKGVMEFNDDSVREVPMGKMLNPGGGFTPYILTYVACGERYDKM